MEPLPSTLSTGMGCGTELLNQTRNCVEVCLSCHLPTSCPFFLHNSYDVVILIRAILQNGFYITFEFIYLLGVLRRLKNVSRRRSALWLGRKSDRTQWKPVTQHRPQLGISVLKKSYLSLVPETPPPPRFKLHWSVTLLLVVFAGLLF